MEKTTIALPRKLRDEIVEFGMKGETYTEILERLVKSARERQLHDLLMSEEGCVTIEEALEEAEKRWPE